MITQYHFKQFNEACHFLLSIKMSNSFICPIDRTQSGGTTPSKWNWDQWQLRDTPYFPKFQHYWSLTIIVYCYIQDTR